MDILRRTTNLFKQNTIVLNFLHGFQNNSLQTFDQQDEAMLKIQGSKFHFYLNETKRTDSCQDLVDLDSSIFLNSRTIAQFILENCQYDINICPLLFRNARVGLLLIKPMIKSYLKTNVFTFSNFNTNNNSDLNAIINMLEIRGENIDLNGNLLNNHIFKNTIRFLASGQINLIQVDVFKSFTKLKGLTLTSRSHKEMFHRNGIEWIKKHKTRNKCRFKKRKSILAKSL